ncbi:MAG: hypothetical protein II477_04085 [Lachnospiraceae bacterium]|nr:hypothetical protein [Lachnospiraceae bacterium]
MAIVGYVLLGIILLLLALLLIILFLPIFYRANAKIDSSGKFVNAKVTWLFGLLRVFFNYPEPGKLVIKVAWFTLGGKDEKKDKPAKKPKKEKDAKEEPSSSDDSNEDASKSPVTESENAPSTEADQPKEPTAPEAAESAEEPVAKQKEEEAKAESPSDQKKKKEKKPKVPIKEKLQKLKDEVVFYKELWEDGNTKPFVKDALARLLHVIKNLLPRKVTGKLLFGAETPDVTGKVYGGYCVVRSLYPKRFFLELTPDFERKVLEGELMVKGHFNVFTILWDGLRILFDKRFKILKRKLDIKKHPEKALEEEPKKKRRRRRRRKKKQQKHTEGKKS